MASVAQSFEEPVRAFEAPIPLRPKTSPAAAYPLDALGPLLGPAASAIMDMVRVPDALAAQSVLAAASLVLQGFIDVKLPFGQVMPTSGFFVTVAGSGSRKSGADRLALAAVSEKEEQLRMAWLRAREDYDADVAAHKKATEIAKKKGDRDEIKRALQEVGGEPAKPVDPFVIVDAPTAQGLQKLYKTSLPTLGLFSDEGGAFLGGYSMQDENRLATSTILSRFWDGRPIKKNIAGEEPLFLPGRRLSFHLMLQPLVSLKLFGSKDLKDQGLMSRILPASPNSLIGKRLHNGYVVRASSQAALDAYQERMAAILRAELPINSNTDQALQPKVVELDEEAAEAFWAFHDYVEVRIGEGGEWEAISGFGAKLAEHACRLAAVVANFGGYTRRLSLEDIGRGIELAQFYAGEMLRLADSSSVPDELAAADQLRDWLTSKWKRPTISLRLITQYLMPTSLRKLGADKLRELCETLVRNRHLIPIQGRHEIDGVGYRECWHIVGGED